jgi:hypothetical protein
MERTPFTKNVSLKAYLNKGKDLNIRQHGVSLIEHMLKQPFHDAIVYYSITRLVAHPNCIVEKDKIQHLLYKNYAEFRFSAIKTEEEKSAFINRFDLVNNIYIAPNNGDRPKEVSYSIGWLQFFLLGEDSFHLFDWAKQYNEQYRDGLKATDKVGFNIWHTLVNAVSNMRDNLDRFDKVHEKLNTLFNDYPEGLKHKNQFNQTPCEMLAQMIKEDKYMYHDNMKKTLNVLEYFNLQLELKDSELPASSHSKKLKV